LEQSHKTLETPLVYDTHQPQLPTELAAKSPGQNKVMILVHFNSISVRNDIAE